MRQLPILGSGRPFFYIPRIENYARNHRDSIAGKFVSGPHVYVGFSDDPRRHLRALRKRIHPLPRIVRVFETDHSMRTLRNVQQRVGREFGRLTRQFGLTLLGTDVSWNRVHLGLEKLDRRAIDKLRDRFGGDKVCFSRQPEGEWVLDGESV